MSDSIEGWCDEQFSPIADAFRANFADGLEIGASVGATWRGKTVVEMWGGWADPDRTRPWVGWHWQCFDSQCSSIPLVAQSSCRRHSTPPGRKRGVEH